MTGRPINALGAIELQTRRELILNRLRQAISSGELAPGTHLAEVELSEALGVSRGTLREALRHLQQEGLLSVDARGRLSVRVVNAAEVTELFAVRCVLEQLAFREICASPHRAAAAKDLRRQLERMRLHESEFLALLEADLDFHQRLCELSENATLLHTWRGVSGLARAAITAAGPGPALHNMAYQRHLPIVELLEAGDVVAGEAFLATHMGEAADGLVVAMTAAAEAAS